MRIDTIENGLDILRRLQSGDVSILDDRKIEFSKDFVLKIELPAPPINSSITPPYMEAFLEIQKQFYQLAALQKTGVANAGNLSEDEKRSLDISVLVKDGSSIFEIGLGDVIQTAITETVSKMSGTQITIVILGMTLVLCATWGFKSYMSKIKNIRMEEIKSKEHIAALEAIASTKKEEYDVIRELLHQNGELGKKAWDVTEKSHEAVIKAASKTEESIINGVHLTQQEAKALRATTRAKTEKETIIRKVRVVDINTSNHFQIVMTLVDEESGDQYKLSFVDRLLDSDAARGKIFDALNKREPIFVELEAKIQDGDIRSVELKKIIEE